MKPSYIFALLLPVATQLATAGPTAGGGHDHDGDHDSNRKDTHDTHDTHNPCEVKVSYPYYKYPCHSAPSNGTSQLGATFTSYCKYQHGEHTGLWFSTPRGWVKDEDKPHKCPGAKDECPV